ncbi:LacI family DNA-binding transcriptional regulator [Marinicrinis sediminis]|uniref:LacI family DNA-binding transcriptional regulator n=1 Tax=Marinicrinis sediminis TaxID=1652465 RepID=A0ABW5R802_9BACL
MAKKVTMQQIADYLGVSKFVVSKALSGKGGVSDSTKERVIDAASELGYFTQKNAYVKQMKNEQVRHPANGSKQSVLVLMPNIRFQTKESLYWGRILDGLSARLEERGIGMVIISEQSMDHFMSLLNPDGILGLIGVGEINTSLLIEVHRVGLPIVLVDHEDSLIPCDTLFVNNVDCMIRMTKHLIGIGHTDIQFLGDITYSRSFKDRWMGYWAAMEDKGLPVDMEERVLTLHGYESSDFLEELKGWIMKRKKNRTLPTAFVCANDSIAVAAVKTLQELNISVPGDVSVSGFDNIEDSYQIRPALTTVNVPKEALGRRAVDKLIERMANPEAPFEKVLIAGEIVFRDSMQEREGRKR